MSSLIVRRAGAAAPVGQPIAVTDEQPSRNYDDLKLFATGWIGGLVFFGTLLS